MNAGTILLLMQGMYWNWWFDAWQGVADLKTAEYSQSE
jgi:hypothetical protein